MDTNSSEPQKFLVVDDEPGVRMVHGFLLEQMGYQPIEAEDGEQALKIIEELNGNIKGMLLDLSMPVMDGIALLNILNERKALPAKTCVVSAGTRVLNNSKEQIIDDLNIPYLAKPADQEQLESILKPA